MKALNQYIQEKYLIDFDSSENNFSDEELREDYKQVEGALTKAEKQVYAKKYGIETNRFRDIQLVILDELRKNRQNKKEFDIKDIADFVKFSIKDKDLDKYLDQEPIDFVYQLYLNKKAQAKKYNLLRFANTYKMRDWHYVMSYNDRSILKDLDAFKKYLQKHHYKGEL